MIVALFAATSLATTAAAPTAMAVSPPASMPANTLRLYVTFDRPARGKVMTRDVRLIDAHGRVVDGAFMDFGQDLWSPDGRRLTVLFDPGRVKRDVEGDGATAAPLEVGYDYTVEVAGKRFHYRATPAIRTPIDPQKWRLVPPGAGSHKALKVTFDRKMDCALLSDQLEVVDAQGRPQSGEATATPSGKAWAWHPRQGWRPGVYRLLIGSRLEDVSGNRVGEALDHDVGSTQAPAEDAAISFKVANP